MKKEELVHHKVVKLDKIGSSIIMGVRATPPGGVACNTHNTTTTVSLCFIVKPRPKTQTPQGPAPTQSNQDPNQFQADWGWH